ncbi:ABC transporter ATP-binding protein [Rhodococcus sp. WWJCD1]|uniref:ABC transporter ATP-binding protein n=1 Tax=unclassified Rhodococcus (in: high G+C Gram-positive bacteria) TaxID=192944 RepID=UPI000B9AE0B5|nr:MULTISPECIES: ABC transporter ATP-binding protein [unclassified Rhodococcus (in: high G+C Gram-positive bacteria)]OZC49648.1 ABC transporter ATP-binding protein [Rhodococcus sp. WWJCD1]OZE82672.1 ABC transporter ATP-binding protein [Rhodococcus sp. 15-649-2-2]
MITQSSTRAEAVSTETALAVHAKGVHKSFSDSTGSKFRAVRELNLSIPRGQVVAFLGPNGAGKSTTIDMILGLTEPDGGTIEVLGTDPLTAASTGRSAAVLQSGGLLPDVTVGALVTMMGSLYIGADPAAAITRAGLGELVNRRVSKCSGGEQQKVRFALALLSDPELLLLDEPTAGMDVTARKHFWQAMHAQAANGTTVMFATHYLEEAQDFADRIVVIVDGALVADGTVAQIKATVSNRTVDANLPRSEAEFVAGQTGSRLQELANGRFRFVCTDTDPVVRALSTSTSATDIAIVSASLDEAFSALTDRTHQN